ncbi:glycosyltransferase family 4 protein [Psychrobacillus psychrodurans]|uniref:Glycosyltransferase family 4 protein n=1 Tax=Psychrobacillus psychrodurans TaxID=126157 RepID=A0A9X3L617_9BACI|nr:glycosyltransferase family 4 protein [Psychrobacillus psychrodurans]MCZ8532010.1 glycosyltransferase family 4 protein [Psychrobacillus psychrodurans]
MKIIFVASVFRHFTTFHIPYMKYLQSMGYEVYAAASNDELGKNELLKIGFTCIDIPFSRSPFSKDNLEAYRNLKSLFKNESFNLVHVHTPVAALLTRIAFRFSSSGKMIYTAHGFHFYKGAPLLNWLIYYPLERLAAHWTDHIITINEEDYKRALTMGFSENSVHYVHGVGVEPIENRSSEENKRILKLKLGISGDAVIISYIAEINENKNHIFLLQNWKRIKEQIPNASLLLIGNGELRVEIEKYVQEHGLKDIHILGFRNDVTELLGISDIVSLLSHREGLPKSIMEAMAARIPCIVSDTRGLRDLITGDESGFVIPHGNDKLLVDSFVTLLNNEKLRNKMGATAYRKVEPYRLENVLEEYVELYNDVLGIGEKT